MNASADSTPPRRSANTLRFVVLLCLILCGFWAWQTYGDVLNLQYVASREAELRNLQQARPLLVYAVAFLIYVTVTGLSLPGAAVLSLLFAWYFGFLRALVLISFASTIGATVAFLLSRYLFRHAFQRRFGERLQKFNASLQQEGAFYLFTLRLIPAVPFFVINVVMGLTPMRTHTFYWVSQLGMLPGTAAYVYAGSGFPSLQELADSGAQGILSPRLIAAFVILGLFPLVVRRIMSTINRPGPPGGTAEEAGSSPQTHESA